MVVQVGSQQLVCGVFYWAVRLVTEYAVKWNQWELRETHQVCFDTRRMPTMIPEEEDNKDSARAPSLYRYWVGSLDFNFWIPFIFPFSQQKLNFLLGDLQHPSSVWA